MSKPSRREKRGIFALLVVGAIPLGIAGYLSYLDADPQIQLPPRAALPSPNGFDLYVQAANLSAQPNPPIDAASDGNSLNISAAQGAIRYGVARREAWNKGAAPAWKIFRQAQNTPTRDAYAYGADLMPGYARLRQLARNKSAQSRLFAMRGENDKAVASALDCVEMAYDISRDGALISRLVASAICAIGIVPLSETSGENKVQPPEQLSGPQARAAAARLETLIARRPPYVVALDNARWDSLAALDKAFKRGDWRARATFDFSGGTLQSEEFSTRVARATVGKRTVVKNIHDSFDAAIANMKAPYAPSPDLEADDSGLDPISAALSLNAKRTRFNAAREKTQLDLLLLRLALQAYRADNGAYPPNLAALQNGYLKRIPTDDFNGGKPYFYAVKSGDYRLWSVGPDAKNDGGVAISARFSRRGKLPWQDFLPSIMPDSAGDVVAGETR